MINTQAHTPIIDTHIHFDDDRFDTDRDRVYTDAINAGVCGMVIPATTKDRWLKITSITEQYKHTFPAYGLHPLFCSEHQNTHLDALEKQVHKGIAIGECGLDKQKHTSDIDDQRDFFEAQIELAKANNLPLIIHARNTIEEVIVRLKNASLTRIEGNGVVHSFNGSIEQARQLIDLNYKLSFGGPLTRTNARKLHTLTAKLPADAFMVETDAPDQTGETHRGQRNEPQWIVEVISAIAAIRKENEDAIIRRSNQNALTLFKLPAEFLAERPKADCVSSQQG